MTHVRSFGFRRAGLPRRNLVLGALFSLTFFVWLILAYPAAWRHGSSIYVSPSAESPTNRAELPYPLSPYPLIPRKVWQTAKDHKGDAYNVFAETWDTENSAWRHEILSDDGIQTFVNETFTHSRPELLDVFHRIETPILKTDLFRYMVLLHYGGLYADIDVQCVKSIDAWLPEEMRIKTGMILGIEYDDNVEVGFPNISLAQYIMVSRPNHPVMEAVIGEAIARLERVGDKMAPNGVPRPGVISAGNESDILDTTGPWMFQQVVFETMSTLSDFQNWTQLHRLHEPTLFGDVVILPINGFGSGQRHSGSGEPDMGEKFVYHHFRRSWIDDETKELDISWRYKQDKLLQLTHASEIERIRAHEGTKTEVDQEELQSERTPETAGNSRPADNSRLADSSRLADNSRPAGNSQPSSDPRPAPDP